MTMASDSEDLWKKKAEAQVDSLHRDLSNLAGGRAGWQHRMEVKLDQLTRLLNELGATQSAPIDPALSLSARNRSGFSNVNASNWSLRDRHSPGASESTPGASIEMGQGRFAAGLPTSPSAKALLSGERPSLSSLLPDLEDSLFCSAKVMPKIDETIANVDATLGTLDLTGASIEPAPNEINTLLDFLKDTSTSVEQDMSESD